MKLNFAVGFKRNRILLYLFCLIFLSSCSVSKEIDRTKLQLDSARQLCAKTRISNHYPGMAVSVSKNGKIVMSQGFGFADIEANIPVDPALSLFRIGSISKAITSIGLAQLYEQDKMDLDDPVQKYVSYFPEKEYPVTIRQIALHTGGIRHYQGFEFMLNKEFKTVEEGIAIFKEDPLLFESGTQYQYSSYGWNLLSAAIEGASGKDFLNYMDENIFNHPKMNCLQAELTKNEPAGLVEFYQLNNENQVIQAMTVDNSYKWAGGGFLACSEDLIVFGNAVLNDYWVSEDTRDHFWTKGKFTNGEETERGLGWASETDEFGRSWVGHGGGSMGGSSILLIYPEERLVIAMLINLSSAKWEGLPFKVADIFLTNQHN